MTSPLRKICLLLSMAPICAAAQDSVTADSIWAHQHYTKREVMIPMRDGVKLFTSIYEPTDKTEKHPILINRTPYSVSPYGGGDTFRAFWKTHYMAYMKEGYILVQQDVRGRYMSEGTIVEVRPYIENKKNTKKQKDIDEASDSYDTIDWLVKNTPNNNGKVGAFGSSYPGFYATMAALSGHPALAAVSPQAPVTDWYMGDDEHHNGAFFLIDNFDFDASFGVPRPVPTKVHAKGFNYYTKDNYQFFLETGAFKHFTALLGDSVEHWKNLVAHPDLDDWWKARNAANYVQHIPDHTATLIVGGLYDAEDCYGAWNLQKAMSEKAKNSHKLVMGPWSHGQWYKDINGGNRLGNIYFGSATSSYYQKQMEIPFFNYYLKGKGSVDAIKNYNIFFSGLNEWRTYDVWPPKEATNLVLYLQPKGKLSPVAPPNNLAPFSEYISDPAKPVPYTEDVHHHRTREYMTDDQRFAARRPDVLVFQTDELPQDYMLAGPVVSDLFASISTTDIDFIVKIIDVYPNDYQQDVTDVQPTKYPMGGYQMLVRGEVMRGRYRKSFEHPEAFKPGETTEVKYTMPDIAHMFKKGHRIMVQVQSTWFPLVDRNPQQFLNIYECEDKDFVKSTVHVYHHTDHPSSITFKRIE